MSFSLAKRARGEGTMAASISRENMIFLGLWFLPIMVCVFAKDKDARFLLPMMVVPGIVVGISVEIVLGALLKQKGFIKYCLIVIALLLFPVSAMVFQSFLSPRHAPDKNDWKINEIVKYMHKEVRASRADDPSFVISLKSHHALNGNTLRYYCAINKFEDTLRFTRWELGQRDINKAVAYIGKTKPSFLIWPAGHLNTGAPNICNVLAEDLHRLLIEGRLPYSLDKVFPLDHGVNIMLYKRKPERLTGQG